MIELEKKPRCRRLACAAFAVLVLAAGSRAYAQSSSEYRFNKDFLKAFGRDFVGVFATPFHWDEDDVGHFALACGATLFTATLDEQIMEWSQAHKSDLSQDVASFFEKCGNGAYLLGFTAVLYGAGEIWHSRGVRKTALLSLESLATSSVIVWITKFIIGRARPETGNYPLSFRMFSTSSAYNSFPSGHTAAAFAVATTIAQQTRGVAVDILAYGTATLVGLARIHENKHWATSVIMGAAVGHLVAKKIEKLNRQREAKRNVDLGFALGPDHVALTLTYVF